jgi:hypothetical protein
LKIIVLLIFIYNLLLSSASIISGTTQNIRFDSKPQGAIVKINGKTICKTPCQENIYKHNGKILTFEKENYISSQLLLGESINPRTIFGSYTGTTTDYLSGSFWEYSPNSYYIELKKK